jgi:hypothetical protein
MATNTYVAINTQTLASAATGITFSSIPNTYTDLVLVLNLISTSAGNDVKVRVNSDSGVNYSETWFGGNGSSASSGRDTNNTAWNSLKLVGTTTAPQTFRFQFQNYSNTTRNKTMLWRSSLAGAEVIAGVGLWNSTAAISTIYVYEAGNTNPQTFAAGTTATLYGILAEGVSPAPKATGGAIYSDSTYYYHVFGASGTFTPSQSLTADYLVVAGGGGSGATTGGGGGAGGFYSTTSASLTAQAYTVTVGGGGAGGTNNGSSGAAGTQGSATSFNSISRTGGGGGSTSPNIPTYAATTGGSGGGGSRSGSSQPGAAGNAGGYTPVEGYAGGNNYSAGGVYGTGGGGGAGGVGQAGSATYDGAGGVGATSSLITAVVNATGVGQLVGSTGYIAGGGGGANGDSASLTPTGAPGGYGGGGNGGSDGGSTIAQAGKKNTGSGAGGSGYIGGYLSGKAGGSGVVIVRYAKA